MIKVTVICVTHRPGYIDTLVGGLSQQTLSQDNWEFILVDDLFDQRKGAVKKYASGKIKNFKHMSPREVKPFYAPESVLNYGIMNAQGELIYFINDSIYVSPRCLQRHYEIYQKYGPKVLISGPIIEAIVASGRSVWTGANPIPTMIKENGKISYFAELVPGIPVKLKDNFDEVVEANFISVFTEPFVPPVVPIRWPDWRLGVITNVKIEPYLFENTSRRGGSWFWGGRNDSAGLEALFVINGFNEKWEGSHGAADGDAGQRMIWTGCRYLVDIEAPCYILIHPLRKRQVISDEDRDKSVTEGMWKQPWLGTPGGLWHTPLVNTYNLREERAKLLKL